MALSSAVEQYRRQQRLTALAVRDARRVRGSDAQIESVVNRYQLAAAQLGADSVPEMLAEQGIPDLPAAGVNPRAFLSDRVAEMAGSAATNHAVDRMVATLVQDAGRAAAGVATTVRPNVHGYVRYLSPPSCSRCAVLAGRVYRYSQGFLRHPLCDCVMVPTTAEIGPELVSDPSVAFSRGQIRGLSKADTQAIRDGADLGQVVNIRRKAAGLSTAGTALTRGGRLTPDGIYTIAKTRDEALALLQKHGYVVARPVAAHQSAALAVSVTEAQRVEWKRLSAADVKARADGSALGNKVAAKTKRAYVSGQHSVVIETAMTDAQAEAFLQDVADVLAKAGDQLTSRPVAFRVPAGDPKFRGTKRITGGYVRHGDSTVYVNPKVASGELDRVGGLGQLMPAAQAVGFRKYTVTHELGHIMDNAHEHTHVSGGFTGSGIELPRMTLEPARDLYQQERDNLSKYGKTNVQESYAEAWAQWVLDGPGSNPVADAYARRYGWR